MQDSFRVIYNWHRIFDQWTPQNLVCLSWQIPLSRERLTVLVSDGVDGVDKETPVVASAARAEVLG